MLNKIKNKTKETKKETKNKKAPEEKKVEQQDVEQEESTDLVDANQLKRDQNKVKQNTRKNNDYQLEQKQIDVSNINLVSNDKPKVITTWVANSVEEVMKKDFKMEKIDHEFISLTDQALNEKLLQKQKQEQQKQKNSKVIEQNNLKIQTFEKTQDQLKMERADGDFHFKQPVANIGISTTQSAAKSFTNSNFNSNNTTFKPIQKTAQELKMEEAERKEQQIAAKKPPTSWFGTKKTGEVEQKPVFKQSAWAAMAVQGQDTGANIKLAELNVEPQKQPARKQEEPKASFKPGGWAANNIQTDSSGMKFAPLQVSKQDEKIQQAGRKQQQYVFVSKKQQEERKKKREEKQKDLKAKEQPKA